MSFTRYAVIETRKTERLIQTSDDPPQISEVPEMRREGDTVISYSIVPVTDGQRIDGGKWPL